MLPKQHRLDDFAACFRAADIKLRTRHCLLLARKLPAAESAAQLGVTVAKRKVGKSNQRNRIKRRVRAAFYHQVRQSRLRACACVLLVRDKAIIQGDNKQIFHEFQQVFARLARALAAPTGSADTAADTRVSAITQPAVRQ